MPLIVCPKGHDSTDADFCSICGAKIQTAPPEAASCPDCGAKRDTAGGMFCEICGYNFDTGAHGELKPVPAAPAPAPPAAQNTHWQVTVTVDPALRDAQSPEPPTVFEPQTILLQHEVSLIGRRSERRGIEPEIALDHDDAVSHRHALLTQLPDGGLTLRDLESANGTVLNGATLPPLTDAAVKDGDVFTLGHWTRVVIGSTP